MAVKIVIPSMGRSSEVSTINAIDNPIICVPESEKKDYEISYPAYEIVGHPDSVKGLSLKRQWMYEHFGDLFMVDDDLGGMYRLFLAPGEEGSRLDPMEARAMIESTHQTAKELGAYLFGFSTCNDQRNYDPAIPFRLKGYCNGYGMGLISGSKLYFDGLAVVVEDYFVSLLNAFHHRYAFFDCRFGFSQKKTFKNRGGCSNYRNNKTERESTEFLKKCFGGAVVEKVGGRGSRSHEFERGMKLPF